MMQVVYAFRRAAFYPFTDADGPGNELPPPAVRPAYLAAVRVAGFEGIEVGVRSAAGDAAAVRALGGELAAAGVPCAVIRGGGGFTHPATAAESHDRMMEAIRKAAWIGANRVNMTVGTPATAPGAPGAVGVGEQTSQGGSRTASEADFAVTARHLRAGAALAAELGVEIAIEMHQHSIADNTWSCLHLLECVDHPNVGINPDLGNLYWTYAEPEGSIEECIVALAPYAKYWHCKQLQRLHIPELSRAYFQKVSLADGDIDYRFAIAAMAAAGYDGPLAIEGVREGDQLTRDARGVEYVRGILQGLAASPSPARAEG